MCQTVTSISDPWNPASLHCAIDREKGGSPIDPRLIYRDQLWNCHIIAVGEQGAEAYSESAPTRADIIVAARRQRGSVRIAGPSVEDHDDEERIHRCGPRAVLVEHGIYCTVEFNFALARDIVTSTVWLYRWVVLYAVRVFHQVTPVAHSLFSARFCLRIFILLWEDSREEITSFIMKRIQSNRARFVAEMMNFHCALAIVLYCFH